MDYTQPFWNSWRLYYKVSHCFVWMFRTEWMECEFTVSHGHTHCSPRLPVLLTLGAFSRDCPCDGTSSPGILSVSPLPSSMLCLALPLLALPYPLSVWLPWTRIYTPDPQSSCVFCVCFYYLVVLNLRASKD